MNHVIDSKTGKLIVQAPIERAGTKYPQAIGYASLGKRLKKARGDLSLRDVEKATGVSNPLICQIEGGKVREPGLFKVAALARYYGISLDKLLEA